MAKQKKPGKREFERGEQAKAFKALDELARSYTTLGIPQSRFRVYAQRWAKSQLQQIKLRADIERAEAQLAALRAKAGQ